MPRPRSWYAPAALGVIAASALWSLVTYWNLFGGDPEIHIIFAKNLIGGYPLQFNPGDFSSGETSPVYMLLVALMYLVVGVYVPIAMKCLGVASLAGISATLYRAARGQGAERPTAVLLAALPLFFPQHLFQALLGMENMLFAWLVVLVLQAWLESRASSRVRAAIGVAGLPLLFFLRPEALLLVACFAILAALERDWRSLAALALGGVAVLAAVIAVQSWTGVPLEAAGQMRAALSRLVSIRFHFFGADLYFSPRVLPSLAYAAPFIALLAWYRKAAGTTSGELVILGVLFVLPLVLHAFNVFPATQFSRYFLYADGAFYLVFARNMARLARGGALPAGGIFLAVVLLAATLVPYEHLLREKQRTQDVVASIRQMAPDFMRANSDALYQALGRPAVPVVVALAEVQIRGKLDERFVVRSLDGVVDARMAAFVHEDWVDQIGYLKARKVAFVLDLTDPNRDKSKFSVSQLPSLGTPVAVEGLCFRHLALAPTLPSGQSDAYAVSQGGAC